jgi:hypothetical protein
MAGTSSAAPPAQARKARAGQPILVARAAHDAESPPTGIPTTALSVTP